MARPNPAALGDATEDSETRVRLIDSAESLFAEHGIESVSLNSIRREAGQRNASALQYHLGSKTDLIRSILVRRMEGINARRLELLAEIPPADRAVRLRGVARALVLPLAEQLDASDGGRNYVRFVAQVYGDPRIDMFNLVRGQHDTSVREIKRVVFALLADLPPQVARMRLEFVSSLFIHALAECARTLAHENRKPRRNEVRVLSENLVDAVVAVLAGEMSAGATPGGDDTET